MDAEVTRVLSELRLILSNIYGARLARLILFGSQARGDEQPASDIDVLVVLHGTVKPGEEIDRTGGEISALSLKNDRVIACAFVSEERFRSEKSPFHLNILREGVPI